MKFKLDDTVEIIDKESIHFGDWGIICGGWQSDNGSVADAEIQVAMMGDDMNSCLFDYDQLKKISGPPIKK